MPTPVSLLLTKPLPIDIFGRGIVRPGQTLKGMVRYNQVDWPENFHSIAILFEGTSTTEIYPHNVETPVHRQTGERVELCRLRLELLSEAYEVQPRRYQLAPGRHEFPFTLVVPTRSKNRRMDGGGGSEYFNNEPQLLPPTLSFGKRLPIGNIEYSIKIVVQTRLGPRPTEYSWPMALTQVLDNVPSSSSEVHRLPNQRWTSRRLHKHQHSLMELLTRLWTGDPALATPSIQFEALVSCPNAGTINQNLSLALCIKHSPSNVVDPQQPFLVVDKLSLKLEALTFIRARRYGRDSAERVTKTIGEIIVPMRGVRLPLDWTPVEMISQHSFEDVVVDGTQLVPSFKSFNVARQYRMRIKVRVRHPVTEHIFRLKTVVPYKMLPCSRASPLTGACMPPEYDNDSLTSRSDRSAAPPPYVE